MVVVRKVGKYELGRTIGEGTFAKVKFAQNTETGESVAMKIVDRNTILKRKMVDQIKREISIMKLVRHPCVVRLYEVLASRTKIYIILEYITGGELFDKIVRNGRLSEAEARKYFHQLIDGVDYCHSKGVYHRDLKPENLLLDSQGNLKISDFGLSALPEQGVTILKTTCGTPNYVAPEVLSHKGYNGAVADVWSCGVILYVLMAGYLPFDEMDLPTLYSKIDNADFSCPSYFALGAKALIRRILDPNPETEQKEAQVGTRDTGPLTLNAFDLIILSQGLNLATLFDRGKDSMKHQTRFISHKPANVVLSSMEVVSQSMGFKTHIRNYKMRVEGLSANKSSHFSVILEVFKVAPSFLMVDIQNAAGDAEEYLKFYKTFCGKLDDIIWKPPDASVRNRVTKTKSKRR
ncbi:CBL-interacting serine/threonine-protein kinase 8 isoform X2 [Brassica rapa]|uniref:CBL-interacting serine/threonine-protein kinase 8 isoform X2 n=1 Tax=Brassica campestris TaxID=3711 RepID=UPI00142E08D5|nr:CBL-interacting serine/threonine-protein kinase 8 isoform X2 [Brassica rapa]